MYPKKFWNEFRLAKWQDKIFVGMWFDTANISKRFDGIIKKAIEESKSGLSPHILNAVITGDSIPVDIMSSIIECKLTVFDISPMFFQKDSPIRNPNVMYELGLAHTWRNKEEVIIVSDNVKSLPFDIQSFGVVEYDIENPVAAAEKIKQTILFRLQEIERIQRGIVKKSAESLNFQAYRILTSSRGNIFHDGNLDAADKILTIPLLLNLGLIEMKTDNKGYGYLPTALGRQVIGNYFKLPLDPDNFETQYLTLHKEEMFRPESSK